MTPADSLLGGVPTSAQSRALLAILGEFGAVERLVLGENIPRGFALRCLMSVAFNLCRHSKLSPVEVFDALGAMASCYQEIEGPARFMEHVEVALRAFCVDQFELPRPRREIKVTVLPARSPRRRRRVRRSSA